MAAHEPMQPDDLVCLCHKVSLRKLVNFMERERPSVASQLSECLGAGTSCQWCVRALEELHAQWASGATPTLDVEPEAYAAGRTAHKAARAAAKARAVEGGASVPPVPPAPTLAPAAGPPGARTDSAPPDRLPNG